MLAIDSSKKLSSVMSATSFCCRADLNRQREEEIVSNYVTCFTSDLYDSYRYCAIAVFRALTKFQNSAHDMSI